MGVDWGQARAGAEGEGGRGAGTVLQTRPNKFLHRGSIPFVQGSGCGEGERGLWEELIGGGVVCFLAGKGGLIWRRPGS